MERLRRLTQVPQAVHMVGLNLCLSGSLLTACEHVCHSLFAELFPFFEPPHPLYLNFSHLSRSRAVQTSPKSLLDHIQPTLISLWIHTAKWIKTFILAHSGSVSISPSLQLEGRDSVNHSSPLLPSLRPSTEVGTQQRARASFL